MFKHFSITISLLFIACLFVQAQENSWTFKTRKYKGAYADGQVRSQHSYVVGKIKYPAIVCEGDTAKMSFQYEGTSVCQYEWKKVGGTGTLATSAELMLEKVTIAARGKYYCRLIDISSKTVLYTDTVELRVKRRPTALIGTPVSPQMICYGDTITLDARASEGDKESGDTYTYLWNGKGMVTMSNLDVIKVAPKDTTTYKVTVNNDGCRAETAVQIDVYRPEVDLPSFLYVAQGEELSLEAKVVPEAVLAWKIDGKEIPHMNPLRYTGLNQSGVVRVRMENAGCWAVDSCSVYLKGGRGYKGGIADGFVRSDHQIYPAEIQYTGSVCEGNKAIFTLDYEGTTMCRYEWRKIGVNEPLTDTTTLVLQKATIADRGKYYCVLVDLVSGNSYFSDTVELKVRKKPVAVIGSPVSPKMICLGDTIILNASATEVGKETDDTYNYSWSGNSIVGNSALPVIKVGPDVTTTYTVMVDNAGCRAEASIEVVVYKPEVNIPEYIYISEGNTLEITADAPMSAKLVWTAEGNIFEDINPFVYPDVRNSMQVSVKMLNEGCRAEDMTRVYVKRGRGYKGGLQDGFDRSCDKPIILKTKRSEGNCVATNAWIEVTAEGSSPEYTWQKFNDLTKRFEDYRPSPASVTGGLGTWRLEFTPLVMEDNGVYICRVHNGCGEAVSDTVSLSVGGVPVLKSGLNKEWDQCVDGKDSTHLNVVAMDPLGETLTYSWYQVDTLRHSYTRLPAENNDYNRPYLKLLLNDKTKHEGIYLVNVENRCGRMRDSVFIPVNMPVQIVAGNGFSKKLTVCSGQDAEFSIATIGGGKVQYKLMKIIRLISEFPLRYEAEYVKGGSPKLVLNGVRKADEGNYLWEVDNGCGKDTSDLIALRIETPPVITARSRDTVLCAGQRINLGCTAIADFSTLNYEWLKNGKSTGVRQPIYTISRISAADAGNYVCRVSNTCPVVESGIIKVEVRDKPVIFDRPYIRSSYCEGDTLKLKVEIAGDIDISSIRWHHNNLPLSDVEGRISGSATKILMLDSILPGDAGNYKLMVQNGCGPSYSEDVRLVVDLPARFQTDLSGYTNLVLCDGAGQALTVAATGATPIRYIWTHNATTIADGFSGTINLTNVKADTAGLYCCEIQNRCGGKVACATIRVSHPDTFRLELNSPVNEICAGDKDGLTAVLMGSDTNTLYYLYREPSILVTKVHGRDIYPKGGFIEFRGLMGGTYYVTGEDTKYTGGCLYRMPGTVVVKEYPQPQSFKVFVKKHFCKEMNQASIALNSSEKELMMEYTLQKLDGATWKPYLAKMRGTGDTLVWNNVPEGSYKVTAKNTTTGCGKDMEGIVEIVERELPVASDLYLENGDSIYCANAQSDVVLQLRSTSAETKYTLLKEGQIYRSSGYVGRWTAVEAGLYSVMAENKWGCRNRMGVQKVLAQQPPRQSSLTGGFIYCKDQTGKGRIEIQHTDLGTLYRVYRESPKVVQLDTMGIGGPILIEVPLEDKKYYVIAQDTTPEQCKMNLLDTAVFVRSNLEVTGTPAELYIPNGTSCTLSVELTGQAGEVSFSWTPANKLQEGQATLQNPQTGALTKREDFVVEVKDESACIATATVSVIMTSGELACDIRKPDKVTSPDTVNTCIGVDTDLYAWVDAGAGAGSYRFLWRDERGLQGSSQNLRNYSPTLPGWLVLEVGSGEIVKKDSVWINPLPSPEKFSLTPSGLICAQKNSPVELNLDHTQAGVKYILSYSTDESRYNETDTIEGTNAGIVFTLSDAYNREGYYQVRAEYIHQVVTCRMPMENIVEIRKGAARFAITGDRTYCESTVAMDTVRIGGRETGIVYTLYRQPSTAVMALPTTELLFSGNFGTGEYFVTGTNGLCTDTMPGRVKIVKNKRPGELQIPEAGGYCDGRCPEQITISAAEAGIEYILSRKNFGLGDTEVDRIQGTGKIVFPQHCEPGEYYVTAKNNTTGCERIFTGRIMIAGDLQEITVAGAGRYCDSEPGYTGRLKIATPQDGVVYQLHTAAGAVVGTFDSLATDGLYFHRLLSAGDYKVKAVAGTCSRMMAQVLKIEKAGVPATDKLIAPYTLCQGDGLLNMKVSSASGYEYQLYRDSAGMVTMMGAPKVGTGGILALGSYDKTGTYKVKVHHALLGCVWTLSEKYEIDKALQPFGITGDTLYCASDGGVVIGVDGTERDIKYVLQKWNASFSEYQEVDNLTGKGLPVAFKGHFPAGQYRVKAVRGCEKLMKGLLEVKSKAMPADSTHISMEGNGCVDSAVVIHLLKTEPAVMYTLYHNGNKVGGAQSGTPLKWDISPAVAGTYSVTADKDQCLMTMPQTVKIGNRPSLGELKGDTLLCANLYGELCMEIWDEGAVYVLKNKENEEISAGVESGGKLWFSSVPVGTFYPVASNGNCVLQGKDYTIDSIAVPRLADDLLKADDCVKRGEGVIEITGMADTLRYILSTSGGITLLDYQGGKSDTLFTGLEFDRYCLSVQNDESRCASDEWCVEIKEGVTADSLTGDFAYCAGEGGATLHLSGSERGMSYQMRTVENDLIEEITGGSLEFVKKYKKGTYLFQKERTGFMGGCISVDTVKIDSFAYPETNVALEVTGSSPVLCAEGNYTVELKNTQVGFQYILVKNAGAVAQQFMDTVAGNGGVAAFPEKLNDNGFYKIYAEPQGGICGLYMDTVFRINALPRAVTAEGCAYCTTDGETDSCSIQISGLTGGVRYYLQGRAVPDTISGPGKGTFKPSCAGTYLILAEDLPTGCRDTVAHAIIRANQKPRVFVVSPVCATSGEIRTMNGSQGDTVSYWLYKDGLQIAGPLKGNGANISFGTYSDGGTYKIRAVSDKGCAQWMADSATLYTPLVDHVLAQEGYYCKESTTGVVLKYSGSERGWRYFLKKGPWVTDSLSGDGKELIWTSIAGKQILSKGKYDLYAYNACETRLLKSFEVKENPLPEIFRIEGKDMAVCSGEGVDIMLDGSQAGVTYQLVYNNGTEQLVKQKAGNGFSLLFGKYSAMGQYIVYGEVDSSGCRTKMDEKMFYPGSTPAVKKINGADICLDGIAEQSIQLSVETPLQNEVNYFLLYKSRKESISVDTIFAGATSASFKTQRNIGCYYVLAEDIATGCRNTMNGQYCIGLPPEVHTIVDAGDTVKLCRGEEHCVGIDMSDAGVKYILQRDGMDYGKAVLGSSESVTVGCVNESGTYKVKAFTGDCRQMMNDSVVVVVYELPGILLQKEYSYCDKGTGVVIGMKKPTYAEFEYRLYAPDGTPLDVKPGNDVLAGHAGFDFAGQHKTAGYYRIEVSGQTGCPRVDSVRVTVHPLPSPFKLNSSNGEWLCVNGSVDLFMDGSESGMEYSLYRKMGAGITDKLVGRKYGTGKKLTIVRVSEAGEYYATATNINTSCTNNMYSSFILKQATVVPVYDLSGLRTGYCYSDPGRGSLLLKSSQLGIVYELFRDGVSAGEKKWGTGRELIWLGLAGKPCSNSVGVNDPGYIYEVLAHDTLTGCEAWMNGKPGIVEETDPVLQAWHPNKDILRCQGQRVDFNLSATGCNLKYQWKKDGNLIKDTTEGFYNIEGVSSSDFGAYTCEVSNSCGSITMPVVHLKVRDSLIYLKRLEDKAVCANSGNDVVLTGAILNGTSHEWFLAGQEADVKSYDSWYKIKNVQIAHGGTYVYRSTNECGTLSDTMVLKTDSEPLLEPVLFRTDTICAGTPYRLRVESNDQIRWYKDGVFTGITGNDLNLNKPVAKDEGFYTVRTQNACGEKITDVAQLYVDDTIKILSIRPGEVICENAMTDLYIRTEPTKRVSYIWERNGVVIARDRSTLRVGPASVDDPEYTYWISYKNRCTEARASIRLTVSNKLEYKDPEPTVQLCAQAGKDTVIFVEHPATLIAGYQWFFQKLSEGGNPVKLEGETYDTLRLVATTANTGYYFCEIGNVCNPVTTNSCWFRVDTVPVLKDTLPDVTLCSGSSVRFTLPATGGGLTYEWNFRFKNDSIAKHEYKNALFSSIGYDQISGIGMKFDSCRVWCRVWNNCGEAYSDTMLLRVNRRRELTVTPDVVAICSTDTAKIEVRLFNGVLPWSYTYTTPSGAEVKVTKIRESVHLLKVQEAGVYQITALEDTVGCIRVDGLPSVEVTHPEGSFVALSGGGARCAGDTVSVRVAITGESTGPWELWFGEKDNKPLPAVNPLVMYGKDTTLMLTAMDSVVYYLTEAKDLSGGAAACPVDVAGEAVIQTTVPDVIDFALSGDDHIGQCNPVNLYTKLNPTHRSSPEVAVPTGWFYLNAGRKPVIYDNLTVDMLKGLKGRQTVRCEYKNALGCLVSSDEVILTVDTLPFATLDAGSGHACGNVQTEYTVELSGAPKFTLELEQRLFSYSRYRLDEQFRRWTPELGVKDTVYKGVRSWTETDSCMILRVVAVTDRHGCRVTSPETALPSDTVYHHLNPDLEIWTRYPNVEKSGWTKGMSPVYIARGDSVGVKATLIQGDRPWNMICNPRGSIRGIHGTDTVFALDTGRYRITAGHDYCNVSASYGEELVVSYRDTGYLKMKVLLDGPFNLDVGEMLTKIEDKLPLYGITALPDHSRVRDKQIIDWIEVELRTGNDVDSIARLGSGTVVIAHDTCLLWSDGTVTDRLGDTVIALPGASVQGVNNYYVLVRHRNHLGVMSAGTFPVSRKRSDVKKVVDFTKAGSIYTADGKQKLHMSELGYAGRTYWALSAGDMNANALVSVFDPNKMNLDELSPDSPGISAPDGYNIFDVNFDGQIGWPGWGKEGTLDWDKVRGNRHQFMEVRF